MTTKLNQVIAVEKGVKSKTYADISEINKIIQKPELFNGLTKTYAPKDEADEILPPESKRVQFAVREVLRAAERSYTEVMNVTLKKDITNCKAIADVVVDGITILTQVPATYLLFLEKQLTDLKTLIGNLPVLDVAEDWKEDVNSSLFKSEESKTHRTKKSVKPLVVYPATDKHPAQTQIIQEDIIAGFWTTVKLSGAMPKVVKSLYLERVERLHQAVICAREAANEAVVNETRDVGGAIFKYVLG